MSFKNQDIVKHNPAAFVDYSTEPSYMSQFTPFLITDVANTLTKYMHFNALVYFFQHFPLHDIIGMLLGHSSNEAARPGYWEYVFFETETRMGDLLLRTDTDQLQLFYEQLSLDLELELAQKSPVYAQAGSYVFYRWADPISLVLCMDNHPARKNKILLPHEDFSV